MKLWRVKTYVRRGKILQKTFSIARYGSGAMQMALDERHRQLQLVDGLTWIHPAEQKLRSTASRKKLPAVPASVPTNQVLRTTNTSSFPGVVRRAQHWTAQTTMGGTWVSQSFRIDEHGEEVALILAVWARLDQLQAGAAHNPLLEANLPGKAPNRAFRSFRREDSAGAAS